MDNNEITVILDLMIENINQVQTFVGNLSYKDFTNNDLIVSAVNFKLIQISENATRLVNKYGIHIIDELNEMKGLRNRVVHDYGSVKLDIIYDTVKKDLPNFKTSLKKNKNQLKNKR